MVATKLIIFRFLYCTVWKSVRLTDTEEENGVNERMLPGVSGEIFAL